MYPCFIRFYYSFYPLLRQIFDDIKKRRICYGNYIHVDTM